MPHSALVAALLLSAVSAQLVAESPTADPAPELAVSDEVTVHARLLPVAAATVTVVTRTEIEASGARSVADVLVFVPGLLTLRSGTRGGRAETFVRGGDSNFTLVLVDGVPMNDPTDPLGGVFNLASLPAEAVDRVEIVRGPFSSLWGTRAVAGIVHVHTRRGEDAPPHLDGSIELGSNDLGRAAVAASGRHAGVDFRVGGGWETEEGRVGADAFEQVELDGRLDFDLGEYTALRVTARATTWDLDDYPEASGGPELGSGDLRTSSHDEVTAALAIVYGRADRFRQEAIASLYSHHVDRDSPAIGFLVPPSTESIRFRRTRLAWTGTATLTPRVRLNVGADVEREDGRNESRLLLPPELGGPIPGDYDVTRDVAGVFLGVVGDARHVVWEVGLRADLPESETPEWSPRLAARVPFFGERTWLAASFGRGFKLPGFFALASPPALGGNPDLEPETSSGGDLGVEHHFGTADARLGVTVFATEYDNLIDFDFEVFQLVNRRRVHARGVELDASARPIPQLTLAANLTWQNVEARDGGAPLPHRPDWIGAIRLDWTPTETLRLRLDTHLVTESRDIAIPVPGRNTVSGYGLVGLGAEWRRTHRLSFVGRVDNLFDRDYETLIGFPGPGRALRLGVRLHAPDRSRNEI